MSARLSGSDTRVKVNNFSVARKLYFTGTGVASITQDLINDRFVIDISGGVGSVTGASNINTAGDGLFAQDNGGVLEFYGIDNASNKLSVTFNATNGTYDFDVVESNITLANLSGSLPDGKLSSNVPLKNASNTFTETQLIFKDTQNLLKLYRDTFTVGNRTALTLDAKNDAGTQTTYAAIQANIATNTAGAENGQLNFQVISAGSLVTKGQVHNNGNFSIGTNLRLILSESGLSAGRIFTYPDLGGTVATLNTSNAFSIAQKITTTSGTALTTYRADQTAGNGVGVIFNMNNSTPAETTYAAIYGVVSTNTAGAEDGAISFQTKKAGTQSEKMYISKDGILGLGETNKVSLSAAALTQNRAVTFADAGGRICLNTFDNSFSAVQTITHNSSNSFLSLYRTANTVGNDLGITFRQQDSASNNTIYGEIRGRIGTNTDTNETGFLDFYTMKNGTLGQYMVLDGTQLSLGLSGSRAVLDSTGVTPSKTFTFPNTAGVLVVDAATQTLTNKSLTSPTVTGTVTLDSTAANYVEFTKAFTNSASENLVKFRLTEDTNSYVDIINGTSTNAVFAPVIRMKQNSVSTVPGGFLIGEIHSSFDTGTVPALSLTGRLHTGGSLGTRPIVDIVSGSTTEYSFGISNLDVKNNNVIGLGYHEFNEISAPSSPSANSMRLYMDSADEHLKAKDSAGNVTDLFTAGSGAPANATYVTLTTDATLSNERVLTAGTGIGLTDAGAGSTITIAIDSTVATLTGSQTLTNKNINLTNNTVTDTSTAAGDLAKSNGTKFLRFAMGTNGTSLKSGASDISWVADPEVYDYLITKNGSNYEALNGVTGVVDYSGTDLGSVWNSAVDIIAAKTNGGILAFRGTLDVTTTIPYWKTKVSIVGVGEGSVLFLANSQNRAAVLESSGFTGLTGGGTNGGVYSANLENFVIDGNKANNGTGGVGIRLYGYDTHFKDIHIKNCKTNGLYTEWDDDAVCPSTGSCMENFYHNIRINGCDAKGWQNKGPHDSIYSNFLIFSCGGTGYEQLYSAGTYDGSIEGTNMHIFDCVGKGIDIQGGTFRGRGITTESITGAGGIGLHQNGGTVLIDGFETYNSEKGLVLGSGGRTKITGIVSRVNKVSGIEVTKNDFILEGVVYDNVNSGSGKGLILGSGGTSLANGHMNLQISGSPTALIDWANASNQGLNLYGTLYTDSTNSVGILNEANIDLNLSNTLALQHLANGTSTKLHKYEPITKGMAQTCNRFQRFGQLSLGQRTMELEGILSGSNMSGAQTWAFDDWEGWTVNFSTASGVADQRAGFNGTSTANSLMCTRRMNPYMYQRIKIPDTSSSRYYAGFSNLTTIPVTDTPIGNSDKGIIIGYRSSDTNWFVFRNDGASTAATPVDTGLAKNTNWTVMEFTTDDANGRISVYLNNGVSTFSATYTTDIPATGDQLIAYGVIENTTTSARTVTFGSTLEFRTKFIP